MNKSILIFLLNYIKIIVAFKKNLLLQFLPKFCRSGMKNKKEFYEYRDTLG